MVFKTTNQRSTHHERQDHDGHQHLSSQTLPLSGLHCSDCAVKMERVISRMDGVAHIEVNFASAKMSVSYDDSKTDYHAIINQIRKLGYDVPEQSASNVERSEQPFLKRNNRIISTAASGILFLAAWITGLAGLVSESTTSVMYAASIVVGGYRIARSGIYGLKSRMIGMELLMAIAAIGAAFIGEWAEGAAVVFLFSVGETLEAFTMERTRKSIRGLMDLAPKTALVLRGEEQYSLPIEQLRIGDVILVKPGDKIAMDGKIIRGNSAINQAPVTGESIPVEKGTGDEVFAGTINEQGALEVEVTKLSKDNTLSRIIHMVEEAQAQKAPSQRFVDVFAKYYTPVVVAAAVGMAVIPTWIFAQSFETWFYRALMMLVVSCPCALVISTPVSIVSAIGNAARNGILIKGGAHLERLGAINAIAFDKTGTLTAGVPEVMEVIPLEGNELSGVLAIAAAIESNSEHPLARAIVRKAQAEGIEFGRCPSGFSSVTGSGAQAVMDEIAYHIGSPRWFRRDLNISLDFIQERIHSLEQQGHTIMLLEAKGKVLALFAVADQIRENSKQVIENLKSIGMKKVVMLTGDNKGTAQALAAKLGAIEYRAELLPQDKVSCLKEMMGEANGVAMVGDGVNDAPALAAATVGIAMGAAGTDTALETADVALMGDDLSKLPYAVRLSRKTLQIIKQNIVFSLMVKAVFLGLIFAGWSTLWMAVLADTGSSLIVIANGMRLLHKLK